MLQEQPLFEAGGTLGDHLNHSPSPQGQLEEVAWSRVTASPRCAHLCPPLGAWSMSRPLRCWGAAPEGAGD